MKPKREVTISEYAILFDCVYNAITVKNNPHITIKTSRLSMIYAKVSLTANGEGFFEKMLPPKTVTSTMNRINSANMFGIKENVNIEKLSRILVTKPNFLFNFPRMREVRNKIIINSPNTIK